jgi:hypothetical protein
MVRSVAEVTLRIVGHPIPRTRPSRRKLLIAFLLDWINLSLPAALLVAMISATAWMQGWI